MVQPEPETTTSAPGESNEGMKDAGPDAVATSDSSDARDTPTHSSSEWRSDQSPGEESEVVYKRVTPVDDIAQQPKPLSEATRARAREISPAITPLIIGFTLLLILICVLGFLSVRRMDEVSLAVLDSQRQHAAKLGLVLNLSLAVTKLDNEARARQQAEARRELKPPFDFRLSTARDEVNGLLGLLERPPLSEDTTWRQFRTDLHSYVEVTKDLRRYSLEGFGKFDVVDKELDQLLAKSGQEQTEIILKSEALQQSAARSIRLWSVIALLVGAIVAAGTIWEAQRRFRQMRRSMFETRRERVFTNQLLEGMVSAVAAVDEDDRIRSANAPFFKIFPGASIGASIYEKFASDDAMKMLEGATSSRVNKATYRGRWVCRAGEDVKSETTFDVYSSPLAIDGERGQILTLVDATEAAESERGLRRSESLAAVGQATAQVAHEIRNPLGSIRLGVSMLRDSVNDQEALKTIELVERGIQHLNKLVVDVTEFSRQKALERSRVNLHELLNMSLDLVSERINEKDTPVEKNFSSEELIGNWDADQLRQVFVNLIANAIDASPAKSPIKLSTASVSLQGQGKGDHLAPKRYARITVADRGKGIDAVAADRVFEPFYSTKKRGTGLGLAIVKHIVDQHEARIFVDSELGKGTRFVIDLPL
jgi:signal transduction histidine kinase